MDFYKTKGTILKLFVILSSLALSFSNILGARIEDSITAEVVSRIHNYMNTTINPCENFYEYSCGNWLKSHSQVIKDTVNNLDKIYNDKLKNLLEGVNEIEYNNSDSIMDRLRMYYKSCQQQQQGFNVTYYLDILRPMDDEVWPEVGESWCPKSKWNVWLTLGKLAGIGLKDIFFYTSWKKDNFTSYQLVVKECNYNSNKFSSVNGKFMTFLEQLNGLCEKHEKRHVKQMTLSELQQTVPNIDFLSYFSGLLGNDDVPLNSVSIIVENLPYYRNLGDLFKRTSQDTIIHTIKLFLGKYLEDNLLNDCITSMRNVLPLALNYIYEKYEYRQQKKTTDKVVQQVFANLQKKYIEILKHHNADDFSVAERKFLNEKILKMKLNIGNLQLNTDNDFYESYYHKWMVVKEKFYENHLNALRHKTLEDLGVRSFSRRPSTFENVLQAFYPFYLFSKNILVVPFQYLLYPEFQPSLHELLQYADLGYSMAHAMMYGLSAFGLQYNAEGLRNVSFSQSLLMNPTLREALECLNTSNSIEIDIKMTDFIGFRLAYDTYFQQADVSEMKIDSDLTDKQLFYLQFAQSECTVRRLPTYTELPLAIQNVVSNSRDFEVVFGCFLKRGVKPSKKCQIW